MYNEARAVDLGVIEPPSITVMFQGHPLEIRPLTVGQLPAMMRALRDVEMPTSLDAHRLASQLPGLIADNGEAIIQAAVIASGEARAVVESAALDEFVELVAAVIEINSDFFVRTLLPTMTLQVARLRQRSAGATHSSH